jgi:hypothetical protein
MAKVSTVDIIVPDEAYDATGWNGDLSVPTKNAVRDAIEALNVPAGSDTQVQFNDGGVLGADAGLTYNKTTDTLIVPNIDGNSLWLDGTGATLEIYNTADTNFVQQTMSGSVFGISVRAFPGLGLNGEIRLFNNLDLQGVYVASALIPDSDDAYDLGSSTNSWAGLYLGPDEAIHFENVVLFAQLPTSKHTHIDSKNTAGAKVLITNQEASFGALLDTTSIASSNKTFTFPNASGTLALVAGSDTQVQFNDGGALNGDAGFTYDKVNTVIELTANGAGIQITGSDAFLGLGDCYVYNQAGNLRLTAETGSEIICEDPVDLSSGVASALIPTLDDGYDLGSSTRAWAGLYLGPDEVIHFNNEEVIYQAVTVKHTVVDTSTTSGAKVLVKNNGATYGALLDTTSINTSNKTFTFPNASGTVALVPGSNSQVIFNNSGALGADAGFTFDTSINDLEISTATGDAGLTATTASATDLAYVALNANSKQAGIYNLDGELHLYAANADGIVFDDTIASNLVPLFSGGYDLGGNTLPWGTLYLENSIYFNGWSLLTAYSTTGIRVGTGAAAGVVAAFGNQDLILRSANTTTAQITVKNGSNAGIDLTPHGTGKVVVSTHLTVTDDAYNATTWNGNNDVPTKNAIRDKIEGLVPGSDTQVIFNDAGVFGGDAGLTYNKTTDTLTVAGGLTVDTNTLFVDASNNRVGINVTPEVPFHVQQTTGTLQARIENTAASGRAIFEVKGDSAYFDMRAHGTTYSETLFGMSVADTSLIMGREGKLIIGTYEATDLVFGSGNTERFTISGSTGVATFQQDVIVPDEAYDATAWNGSLEVPTKNAIRDKIESMSSGSGISRTVVVTSGNVTMGSSASTDYVYFVAGAHVLSLPAASGNTNRYTVKNNHSANVTIDTAGAENVEGAASISIAPEESVDFISDGTNWWVV